MALKPLNSVAGFSVGETPSTIILANGDITTTNFTASGRSNLNAIGNVYISGGSLGQVIQTDGSGNLSFVTISTSGLVNGTSNINVLNNGNITFSSAGNANVAVITGTGLVVAGTFSSSGNAAVANLGTGIISATGNVNGANLVTGGLVTATGNVTAGNLVTGGVVSATGNVTGGNFNTAGQFVTTVATSTAPLVVSSTTRVANLNVATAGVANTVNDAAQPNITSVGTLTLLSVSGNANVGNLGTAGLITATGNVTGGNIVTGGAISATGNANVGNIGATAGVFTTVAGSLTTAAQPNITSTGTLTTLSVSGNANIGNIGTSLITASGNIQASNIQATSNISGSNVNAGNMYASGSLTASGNASFTGNITGGNLITGGLITATGNVTAGNLVTGGALSVTGNANIGNVGATSFVTPATTINSGVSTSGNVTGGNIITGGVVSATGNVTGGNVLTNQVVGTNLTLTSTGNLILSPSGNVNVNSKNINSVANPVLSNDAATKEYVDNAVSAGLDIHPSVINDADTNLSGTYTNGGTTPTWTSITGTNTVVTGSAHGLSIGDVIVFGTTTNGITAGTAYFVKTVPTTTSITLSLTYNGVEITSLTAGTGLSITSRANSGVGATLTSTGTGPLTIESYTAVLNDRILLVGQSDPTQNGVYYVSQVGVVSSTPWILTRATDGNKYAPNSASNLDQGAYFLVTGGSDAGEAYVMTTVGTIVFGTTSITFSQFSTQSIYTAGTGLTLAPNNQFYISNTAVTSGSYGNGDSVATFTVNGQGQITAAANTAITANAANLSGTTLKSTVVTSSLTAVGTLTSLSVSGNANIGNIGTAGVVSATGNVTGGNLVTGGLVTAVGNVTAGNVVTTGAVNAGTLSVSGTTNLGAVGNVTITGGSANYLLQTNGSGTLTWVAPPSTATIANGTSNVNISTSGGNVNTSVGGNANIFVVTGTGANVNGTFSSSGNANVSNLGTGGLITATGNVTAGNLVTGGVVSATGNATAGNISTAGIVTATGNVTGGNLVTGGLVTATGNITGANLVTGGVISATGNANVGNIGTGGLITATGNITGGNLVTGGVVSATGNVSGGNIVSGGAANVATNLNIGNSTINTTITWASATTTSISANQTIASFSTTGVTGVEYLVKGIDSTGAKYSVAFVHAVTDGANVDYVTSGTAQLGGYTGSLAVNISGGFIRLQVTPASSNSTVWTTQYRLI